MPQTCPSSRRYSTAIPSLIRGLVFGYIDAHVFEALYDKVPVMQWMTGVLDDLASIVTKFEVVTVVATSTGRRDGGHTAQPSRGRTVERNRERLFWHRRREGPDLVG
jgi:hypothetical protein